MINQSSIKYISSLLSRPDTVTDGDHSSIALFRQTFPYFVPARYIQAAEQYKKTAFSPEMLSQIQPYVGNWLLFCNFLEAGKMNGKQAQPSQADNKISDKITDKITDKKNAGPVQPYITPEEKRPIQKVPGFIQQGNAGQQKQSPVPPPVAPEIKAEPIKQPIQAEVKAPPVVAAIKAEVKAEPVPPVVAEVKIPPPVPPVVSEVKVETKAEPVPSIVAEVKVTPPVPPVVSEVKVETKAEPVPPIVAEVKVTPPVPPVVPEIKVETKTEPVPPIVAEVKVTPPVPPVVPEIKVETKTEPVPPIVAEVKVTPPVVPEIKAEIKTEPVKPIVAEAKVMPPVPPVVPEIKVEKEIPVADAENKQGHPVQPVPTKTGAEKETITEGHTAHPLEKQELVTKLVPAKVIVKKQVEIAEGINPIEVAKEEETTITLATPEATVIAAEIAATDAETEGLILPVYTEDYFLQQGLKVSIDIPAEIDEFKDVSETDDEEDKSLMVVMSFSEWLLHFKNTAEKQKEEKKDQKALKTMWQKEKLAAAMEEENEEIPENVFEMAVNSITKEDGLASESLADIYIKQGKYDKAIEMYRKLSLRNPKKNTYFARRIEEVLKEKQS